LAVITGDEAKTLHGVEKLDRPGGFLARKLALGRSFAFCDRDGITEDLQVACGNLAAAIDELKLKLLTFCESLKPGALNRTDVHENVFAAIVTLDEAETLASVEEFDDAFALADDLRGHTAAASTATAAATEAATTAAKSAAATTASAAAAEAITASAAKPVVASCAALLPTEERIELLFSEPIAFVASPTATTSVKTHL
jgi:hypothetical protein